ncbi:DNA/RNA non-specific endonuclease [Gluconobacter japonicus]|uniref:DNA/RNA non-specific endonuclease n=1 Tax=Gluconobacter japonicus TaxID=376620 RepID=UPI0024ADDA08|nr:DNA/RNA non-specific endonuclease [Gluconobacter japonicus]MDI6652772.1 DNA/RNA non-specific endonuclease [Gluconobacter japonicus]
MGIGQRIILGALLELVTLCGARAASCPQFFAGNTPPALLSETQKIGTVLLCNDDYAVLVSEQTKSPLWSAENLTEENVTLARKTQRNGSFQPDERLPRTMQALLSDYHSSGYDRGHMTPSGDEPDTTSQNQSFLLSNIVPQTAELNRGAWEGVESAVRGWAEQEGEIFVVTGPGYDPDHFQKTIGANRIPVPAVTWKAVYDPAGNGTGAYVCLNTFHPTCKITSVAMLTQLVNIDPFPSLPASLKDHVSAMPPVRQSPYALAHRSSGKKLLKEWGTKAAQKALRALVQALRP